MTAIPPPIPDQMDLQEMVANLHRRLIKLEGAPAPSGFRVAIAGLLSSKKALTALGTVLALVAGKLGWKVDDEMAMTFAAIGLALIGGYALEDVGKAAAKVNVQQ